MVRIHDSARSSVRYVLNEAKCATAVESTKDSYFRYVRCVRVALDRDLGLFVRECSSIGRKLRRVRL
jgi:hypothetical protein